MLDVAWPEVLVVGAVALVAIGPKDMPNVMYTLGKWARKAVVLGQDMRRAFDQMTIEAEAANKENKTHPKISDE